MIQWAIFILSFLLTNCSIVSKTQQSNVTAKNVLNQPTPVSSVIVPTYPLSSKVAFFEQKINDYFVKYKWKKNPFNQSKWFHVRETQAGWPLIWTIFGEEENLSKKNVTLFLCGVHGDEITPVKFCFDLIEHLKRTSLSKNDVVVIAPLVTPDSFLSTRPSRTNARKIDVNRNFPTKDWYKSAHLLWKNRFKKDPRKYPGKYPASEQEVIFQMNLIKRYQPKKIISVHAPLTLIDYDGPTVVSDDGHEGLDPQIFLAEISKRAMGYSVKNYPFFPGSLGNWAGNERNIPTYTLELPSSDYSKHAYYWELFKEAIMYAISSPHKLSN